MTGFEITEAGAVQFPMVRHATEVGWEPLQPPVATEKRGGASGLLFEDELKDALRKFNPWMSDDAIRSTTEHLKALPATIEGNRKMLTWLRGERQCYDEQQKHDRRVHLIDFERPDNNVLHVTWEWRLKPLVRKANQADVMFVVNGIPVAIVEHKNPAHGDAIERGISQLQRYEAETPELLGATQIFNVTNLFDYWYGATWNVSRRFMARWKERQEETYRYAVQSFFEPVEFLRTLKDCILFYVEDGELRKSVLRQHQRSAIDSIMRRCSDSEKHRGLVWHTQGSGKTFTLLTAARLILERKADFSNPTVIVVVDRTELEGQLSAWVERLLGEMQQYDIPIKRATSGANLRNLLKNDRRGLIVSMIHKFDGIEKDANDRDNIYVFIDEAHRSVARELGTYLMAAIPNSTIIGFTGTPVTRTARGQGTFDIFGAGDEQGYLDKYTIAESIEDETTLPISYTMAQSELTVPTDLLDQEFLNLAETEDITDNDKLNKALDRAVSLRTFLSADDRIEKVAAHIANHFRDNVDPLGYKAFVVAVNREACAKYKLALDQYLPPEWTVPVYTANDADVAERPHVADLQISPESEADARSMFKKADQDPKLLIVTDKLLTGYDAPILYCMYLDKPMRDHLLLQAISRVNRPYTNSEGRSKSIGLVVDFVGVLRDLRSALRFDSTDVSGAVEDLDSLMVDFSRKMAEAMNSYSDVIGDDVPDSGAVSADLFWEYVVYDRFLEHEARKTLFTTFKDLERLWEILSPSNELRDHIDAFKRLARLYAAVHAAHSEHPGFVGDLARKTQKLVESEATLEGPSLSSKSITFNLANVKALQAEPDRAKAGVFYLVRGLSQEIELEPRMEPLLRPLKERAESILNDMKDGAIADAQAIDMLSDLVEEKVEALAAESDSDLGTRAFATYWALKDDEGLSASGVNTLDLARQADALLARFPNAAVNPEEQRQLRSALYQPLLNQPLLKMEATDRANIVDRIVSLLFDAEDESGR